MEQLIPQDAVEADQSEARAEFEVWPEHADAVTLLEACETQWEVLVGFGGIHYKGLPAERVDTVMRWLGIKPSKELVWQLRVLMHEVKQLLNS